MFDNLFTSSSTVWTGLISGAILLPILIHLINLVRYKKVPFAAMDFLLQSQKQSRNYIWLKQLLLLLTRIAALLLALFLMGQVGCQQDRIARILGGRSTHHYVLIDDSFSMTDSGTRFAEISSGTAATAFDRAKSVLMSIAGRVSNRQDQKFSLLRFSAGDPLDVDSQSLRFDIENQLVDSSFNRLLDETRGELKPSSLSLTPKSVLERLTATIEDRKDENPILYVLSDFRSKDWEQIRDINDDLLKIKNANGAVELIDCASGQSGNLAVVELQPAGNVRVVTTPLMMEVKIKNLSDSTVSKVFSKLETDTFSQSSTPAGLVGKTEDLPALFIEEIEAGQTVSRLFPVYFSSPGSHAVTVRLQDDSIAVDNRRSCVVKIEERSKVLLIDDANQRHSSFVKLALNPNNLTGIEAVTEPKSYLRDVDPTQLDQYDAIFMLDVDAFDAVAAKNLQTYCQSGGGVAFFLGPNANIPFYNSLYEQGSGLFPIELDQVVEVEERLQAGAADFFPLPHPIFAPVLNQKTSLLDLVDIEKIISPTRQWLLSPPTAVETIATLRGDSQRPLLVESSIGEGRVIVCTTTAGPVWNNWAKNATYLPILLLIEDHLASGKKRTQDLTLSSGLVLRKPAKGFLPDVTVLAPTDESTDQGGQASFEERTSQELTLEPSSESENLELRLPTFTTDGRANLQTAGVVDFWFQDTAGTYSVDRKAINVDTSESALERKNSAKLLSELKEVQPTLVAWDQFNPEPELRPASSLSRLFLLLLVCVFALEPFLAYLSSFHHK